MTESRLFCTWRTMSGALLLTIGLMAAPTMAAPGGFPACNAKAGACCDLAGTGTPGCEDTECCNIVCNDDTFCCDVVWDGICATSALSLCALCAGTTSCCDPEDLVEPEDCGLDLNGGCNVSPPVYTGAAIGDTYCGTSWSDGVTRDTDWYIVAVPEGGRLTSTLRSEFNGVTFIIDISDCAGAGAVVIGQTGTSIDCLPLTVASADNLAAGNYVVFVSTVVGLIAPCDPNVGSSYSVEITDGPPPPPGEGVPCVNSGDTQLTQSNDLVVVAFTGIACADQVTGQTTENFFGRSYAIQSDLNISCVRWGIETNSGLADHPADINIYLDTNGGAPDSPIGDLQLIGTVPVIINAQSPLTLVPGDFDPPIEVLAGQQIVVEINVSSGQTSIPTTGIWPGANALGETGDGYLKAEACGLLGYLTMTAIGFPDSHMVNTVNGTAGGKIPCLGDLDNNGIVNTNDLLIIFANWGVGGGGGIADLDENGIVNTNDLLIIFANWGPCP